MVASIFASLASSFNPASLFAAGEEGALFLPSPTTCFTDTARTIPAAVNDAVAGMTDLSGRGNHASQATASARPVLRQDGALFYLEFDGTDDQFSINMPFAASSALSIVAGQRTLASAPRFLIDRTFGNGSFEIQTGQSAGFNQYRFRAQGTTSVAIVSSASFPPPHTGILTCEASIPTPLTNIRVNGVQEGTSALSLGTGNFANGTTFLGCQRTLANFFQGRVFGLIMLGRQLTTAERTASEQFIAQLSGVVI